MSPKKICYYELLGLDRKCDAVEIKKTYRKLALQMHPDKAHANNISVEEATNRFQQIQEAYSCLSDPQERAWYDAHREQILRGDDEPGEDPFKTKINLYKYFGAGCYSGFGDNEGGFFNVYSDLFSAIDHEEEEWEDADEDHVAMPSFGASDSEWADVSSFYRQWLEFCSRKAFGHADKWNPKDAPNRQVKRAMEQENKKARQVAKKEFNSEVRQIVGTVQRRDPRVQQHRKQEMKDSAEKMQREAAEKEKRKKTEAKERQERKDAARQAEEDRWAEMQAQKEARRARGEVVSEDEGSSSSSEEAVAYNCEPCRKSFKSEKVFDQHCKSKKHLQIVQVLRKKLDQELAEAAAEEEESDEEDDDDSDDEEDDEQANPEAPSVGLFPAYSVLTEMKLSELRKKAIEMGGSEKEIEEADDTDDTKAAFIELVLRLKSKPKAAPNSSASQATTPKADRDSEDGTSSESDSDDVFLKAAAKAAAARKQRTQQGSPADFAPPARSKILEPSSDAGSSAADGKGDGSDQEVVEDAGSKKAQKRAKQKEILLEKAKEKEKVQELVSSVRKAQQSDAAEAKAEGVAEEAEHVASPSAPAPRKAKGSAAPKSGGSAGPTDSDCKCAICGEEFPSRSKMFQHVRITGHAAPKEVEEAPARAGKKKKR